MKKYNKILLATGGTGGHIFPALALKKTLNDNGFDVKIAADAKFEKFHPFDPNHIFIPSANFSNKNFFKLFFALLILAQGFLKSLWIIYKDNPSIVVGFGGYASFPVIAAAIVLNKKVILHEANTVIGKVNKIFSFKAEYITTGFNTIKNINEKYRNKVIHTGNPIREDILSASLKKDYIKNDKLYILIIGGSQGAKVFSRIIPSAIINLPKNIKNVLHISQQVKEEDIDELKKKYQQEGIDCEIKSFFYDMNQKLDKANLVIARAGASTISELIAFNLPAIFIPYPSAADNHQYYNANALVEVGSSWIVEENADSHIKITSIIEEIYKNRNILNQYASNLKPLFENGSNNILQLIQKIIEKM